MLDAHPQMAVPPESHFLVTMGRWRRRYKGGDRFDVDRFVRDLANQYGFRRWDLDPESVRNRLADTCPRSYPEAMRDVFALYADQAGKSRYAEKTPTNVVHMPFLARTFPEARFIHLIRDGRDVALSYLDADFGVESLGEAAIYWRRFVRKGRRDGQRLGSRYREIRYEDLVADPEASLRSLCAFIEIPYHPAMLQYQERADGILATTSHAEHHQRIRLAPTRGLRDWRTQMEPDNVALFEALAGDTLAELGYETGTDAIPLSIRLRAVRTRATVFAQRVRRRAAKGLRGLRPTPRDRNRSGRTPSALEPASRIGRSP